MADMQIVAAGASKNVEAQYVELMVPLYSHGCERKVKNTLSNLKEVEYLYTPSLSRLQNSVGLNCYKFHEKMMMGFAPYGNGGGGAGGSSSSSSNLSALAPPFTVDRSVPKPLVDLAELPLNWLNTHSLNFESLPSSNAYGYTFSSPSSHIPSLNNNSSPVTSTDAAFLYGGQTTSDSSFVEAKPYYPSYVSPPKFSYDDYTQSLSGLWDGSRGEEYGQKVEVGDGFCSKEMNMADSSTYKDYNPVVHSSKGPNTCEEKSNSIDIMGSEKHPGSSIRDPLHYSSFPGKKSEFTPVEYSRKSVLESTSVFPDTYSIASPADQVRYRNLQMPYGASYEKFVKQQGTNPNNITSVMKSSPGLVISTVGSGAEAPKTSSFHSVEIGSGADDIQFACSNNFPNTKDFHPLQSSQRKLRFDSSQASFQLERDNRNFQESSLEKNVKLVGDVNVTEDPFSAKSGLQAPHISHGFNLTLDSNEAVNRFDESSESFDHYNPAVDSPCWKGAPVSHYSPSETSGAVPPQLRKKIELSNSSTHMGPLSFPVNADFSVKFSSQKPSEYSMYQESGCLENNLAPSPKRPSVENLLTRKHESEDDVKAGSYHKKQSSGHGVQFSDYLDKPRKQYVLSNKSVDEFNFKPFHSMQQSPDRGELTSGKNCGVWTGGADVGMNTNDALEGCSSHVPFHVTEQVLSSPSTELNNMHGENTSPKIKMCVQKLISTMHVVSEQLLYHCSNESYELKKQDMEVLKNVINNLDKCILKNFGRVSPPQQSLFSQKTYQFHAELPGLHESVTASRPRVTKAAVAIDLNQPEYQHVQEERKHYGMLGKKDDKCSDVGSELGDADRVKEDKMTQAIKKVLVENFVEEETQPQILLYKNLWLEAEAALCSVMCRSRFNRVKTELERCKLQKAKDLSANTTELEEVSQGTFSPDLNMGSKLAPEVNSDSTRDIPIPDSPIISTNNHPEDILTRFHILSRQATDANSMSTTYAEELSSPKVFPDLNKADKMASDAKDATDISTWGSFLSRSSSTSPADDAEASVMARFRMLKSRVDHSSNVNMPQVDLGFAGDRKHMPTNTSGNEILDINTEHVLHPDSAKEKLTVQEFHLHVKDDPIIHSHSMNRSGNQVPASCYYDNSSSDWEHVLKEELPGQNC
ncbi:hypothetical protein LWI29_003314 [Acer saccharum]|uniref:Uncharacterized protein n=1 Tax=Acer saccharum TaxID=4024 RepID=A0AA39S658_ACESA|nr:hypothetical protein LWI29_003314 [Acer saccharum]